VRGGWIQRRDVVDRFAAYRRDEEKLREQQQADTGGATSKANGAPAKTSGACLHGERHLISRRARGAEVNNKRREPAAEGNNKRRERRRKHRYTGFRRRP
jgi:hypothetical protein